MGWMHCRRRRLPWRSRFSKDLRARLRATNWPEDDGNEDGRYGVPRALLQESVQYWAEEYGWRAAERSMNAYDHYLVEVSGTRVHFMRKPGVGPDPTPLILSHGWPWTFWHWSKVIDRLADPAAFGGDPADARARAQSPRSIQCLEATDLPVEQFPVTGCRFVVGQSINGEAAGVLCR